MTSRVHLEGRGAVRDPILFSGAMVRAILEGRKTQTRRVLKSPDATCPDPRPYRKDYEVGMRLWVRETMHRGEDGIWHYSADCSQVLVDHKDKSAMLVWAFERAKRGTDKEVVKLIRDYDLPRECVPTGMLKSADIWEALLEKMPMTAMIRNLGNMTDVGVVAALSVGAKKVVERLESQEAIQRAKVHPIQLLMTLMTYKSGKGVRGSKTWTPVQTVCAALDSAFYLAFKNVAPTDARYYLALDVSGSMTGGEVAGVPGLSPRMASSALAMVTMRTEAQHVAMGFTEGNRPSLHCSAGGRYGAGISELSIHKGMGLDEVVRYTSGLSFGGTDCALPMLDALERKIPVDVFVVYTDSETWSGGVHPMAALRDYRQKMGIAAKLVIYGMTATNFSIADPNDGGSLDVVGFDGAAPGVVADFVRSGFTV